MKPTIKKLMISSAQLMGAEKMYLPITLEKFKSRLRRNNPPTKRRKINRIGRAGSLHREPPAFGLEKTHRFPYPGAGKFDHPRCDQGTLCIDH